MGIIGAARIVRSDGTGGRPAGPGPDPAGFAPWSADAKYLQGPANEGPYKFAVVSGFVGKTWRIQMVKTAKAQDAVSTLSGATGRRW